MFFSINTFLHSLLSSILFNSYLFHNLSLGGSDGKVPACQCRRREFDPWVWKIPWRRKQQPAPVFLPGESHGQRSLEGYSAWGCKESDTPEGLSADYS